MNTASGISSMDKFTLVLYGPFGPYRCFEIGKRPLKIFLLAIPIVILSSILMLSLMYSYFTHLQTLPFSAPQEVVPPSISSNDSSKLVEDLKKQIATLEKNAQKTTKVLGLFSSSSKIAKIQNNTLKIEKVKWEKDNTIPNNYSLKFELVNSRPTETEKITGTLFVLLSLPNSGSMKVYPKQSLPSEVFTNNNFFSSNQGESFVFSKVRFVKANFQLADFEFVKNTKLDFLILLFSKTGEILLQQKITQ